MPPAAARHVQVLRCQPGDGLTLFNGLPPGGEFSATVLRMGRSDVQVEVGVHDAVERELPVQVHLVLGMPANERMDWLVEKATELGVASIQPLVTERSVLRLSGERATKKQAHWQSVAVAACEQCGRNQVPVIHEVLSLDKWLARVVAAPSLASTPLAPWLLLSFREGSRPAGHWLAGLREAVGTGGVGHGGCGASLTLLSGPEGGLSAAEEALALRQGFAPATLGPRVLRAETAPLALLGALVLAL